MNNERLLGVAGGAKCRTVLIAPPLMLDKSLTFSIVQVSLTLLSLNRDFGEVAAKQTEEYNNLRVA